MDAIKSMGITVNRIDGDSIEDVNINIVKKYNPSPAKMALARNDLFADALSGASFALKNQSPIFLTGSNYVTSKLKSFILSLTTTENYIFGGPAAINDSVVNELIPATITIPPIQKLPDIKIPILDWDILPGGIKPKSLQGNTSSNINTMGIAAASGDWIYFRLSHGLYKSKVDGSSLTKLVDGFPEFINVSGDYIYYEDASDNNHVYKLKTDNSFRIKVINEKSSQVTVLGDWIYYRNLTDSKLYKIKTDGTGKTGIVDEKANLMNINGGWIYYLNTEGDDKVCRIKLDGTEKQELFTKNISLMNVQGDWIYYIDKDNWKFIYRTNLSSLTAATKLSINQALLMNVTGDWIYYTDATDMRLYKMKTDGTGVVKLNDIQSAYPSIVGEWIHYIAVSQNSTFRKMKLDGSQDQELVEP